jgi:amino acid transporter
MAWKWYDVVEAVRGGLMGVFVVVMVITFFSGENDYFNDRLTTLFWAFFFLLVCSVTDFILIRYKDKWGWKDLQWYDRLVLVRAFIPTVFVLFVVFLLLALAAGFMEHHTSSIFLVALYFLICVFMFFGYFVAGFGIPVLRELYHWIQGMIK